MKQLRVVQEAIGSHADRKEFDVEMCYTEFNREEELPFSRFFMTLLHTANELGHVDIVSSI